MGIKGNQLPVGSESDVQKAISDWLSWKHIVHWRQNSGAVAGTYTDRHGKKKSRFIKFIRFCYPKGNYSFSDIAGIYKGKFFAIEVKRPGQAPTQGQSNFINLVNDKGGMAFIAHSLDEAVSYFEQNDTWYQP